GYSTFGHRPVREVILEAAPRTLSLAFISLALASLLGVLLGVVAAARHRALPDRLISTISVVVYSIPEFCLALIIQLTRGFKLAAFPISGVTEATIASYGSAGEIFRDRVHHMVLPTLALTILLAVILARFQRAAMIDVLPSDYLRTARAKGAPERTV